MTVRLLAGSILLVITLAGCADSPAADMQEAAATVAGVEPWDAAQGETVTVRILGSGFTPEDVPVWERNGSEVSGISVAQTTFVSSTELTAVINIAPGTAALTYDVGIRRGGRKRGVGSELFDVLHGIGSILDAQFAFGYRGDRTGSFSIDREFVLDPEVMYTPASGWGVTLYHYPMGEQFLMAQQPRADGLADFIMCWSPGGRVRTTGTRLLECWLEFGLDADGNVEASYSSWIGSDRPADGSGRITFSSIGPRRLAGTFHITMHSDLAPEYPGPELEVFAGSFDLPVVSAYFDQ
jgi:hypothetical protein